jgi:hypothetical protein
MNAKIKRLVRKLLGEFHLSTGTLDQSEVEAMSDSWTDVRTMDIAATVLDWMKKNKVNLIEIWE